MTAAATMRVVIALLSPFMCSSSSRMPLLTRRCANTVPCIADLVVMNLRKIVRRVQVKDMHVKPSDCAEQRIGRDHPVALGQN